MGSEASVAASVRRAGREDAAEIAALVNRAYQVERFFVDGDRIDEAEVARLCAAGEILVLDGRRGEIAAAIQVRSDGARGTFGMLSVLPDWQGHGLGRRLVAVAEALCAAMGCAAMELQVVDLRTELTLWYRSLGYRAVGVAPYVAHRTAKVACHFIVMQKLLAATLAA